MSELRVFTELPEAGELVLSRDAGGWRHYLDGRAVFCGMALRLKRLCAGVEVEGGRGTVVIYESTLRGPSAPAVLRFSDGSERFADKADRFEWPKAHAKAAR
jgi:hypothetical protein